MASKSQNVSMESGKGGRIVISGMSGLYPKSYHVKDLENILYNKINPVTSSESRWTFSHPEMTGYTGKVPDLIYFDAQFFKVHYLLASNMDVMSRKILELAYAAIYDAGVNPEQLSGQKVGVYLGTSMSENEIIASYKMKLQSNGFVIMGSNKSMFANRISYWLNGKGPSMSVDQACCSSSVALELAYQAILRGDCDSAIVGGTSLCLHPHSLIQYGRVLKLNRDGKTRSYDENADGSVKSEAINVLFLQKEKDALRIYAEVVYVKSCFTPVEEDKTGTRYGIYRNPSDMIQFLTQFYKESNVSPQAVQYVEGYGSASPEADKAELEVYEEVFCGNRNNPLLVGSVMSNIGNVEAASGITAITKILLGYQRGVLAGNLHCKNPRRDVKALRDSRMIIVNDHVPFGNGYAAVNGLSITGGNVHILLKGRYKPKDSARYKSPIPHLVFISARQDSGVLKILNDLKSRPVDPEEIALMNNVHGTRISGNLGRGFAILDTKEGNKTVSLCEKAGYLDYAKRPLWFVYSGMGSQYNGMGTHLMRIPVFAAAIERCQRALQPKGIDIVHIITSSDKTLFDNILHSFVGIAAIQIGLTDILRELGIVPDKIIGHSVGELGCAYADGCFTAEEMILSAYSRGLVSIQTSLIRGSMAAVGIGHQQIAEMCPPEIEVACHNSRDSCTISGPYDIMREFVARLVSRGIFAKEVPCSNIAYHSRYIANAGPGLLKYLSEVIKNPKPRSDRWVSTSVPKDKWDESHAKYSSAEYHTNNLLNAVLFEETTTLIPLNAILVEIAPHGLLQSILKRSLPETCTNIPLTRRGCQDNAIFLLEAIGNLYMQGLNPKIEMLYSKIEFPVSTGTPMMSHLLEWAHHEKWSVPLYLMASKKTASAATYIISLHDEEQSYLKGHVIGGKILYPFSAILVAVWDTLAMTLDVSKRRLAVQFRDVSLNVQPILHDRRQLRLSITIQRCSGQFEVMDDVESKVMSGFINAEKDCSEISQDEIESQSPVITSKEIYDYFLLRGFTYTDCFKSIHSTNMSFTEAKIQWCGNWVTFIDGIFQLNNLHHSHDAYSLPNFIRNLSIDPTAQYKYNDSHMTAVVVEDAKITKCGGVLMENVNFNDLPKPTENSTKLRGLKFVPHFASDQFDFETILQVYLQIVAENVGTKFITILGIYDNQNTLSKLNDIKHVMEGVPEVATTFTWLQRDSIVKEQRRNFSDVKLVLISDLANDDYLCQILHEVIEHNTFIINIRDSISNMTNIARPSALYQVVCDHSIDSSLALELTRWRPTNITAYTSAISVYSSSDFPLMFHEIDSLLPHQSLLVVTTYPAVPLLKTLLNQFNSKPDCNIYLVMNNYVGKEFDDNALINGGLAVKIIKDGVIGGEYYIPLHDEGNAIGNYMMLQSSGDRIESLKWIQACPLQQSAGISVKVHYASINDLDAKKLTGTIPSDTICRGYGMDFSGITESGERVMGLVNCGAASTLIQADPDLLWPVPSYWSLEDAATTPFAYCLAYYCLAIKCKLFPGKRVLVHGGAGGLGQAIISLALANRCEVFVTVANTRKKQFLLKMYPDLKAENIGNSRDLSFCDLVLNVTSGKGANIVVSTLNGEPKQMSFHCVANSGTMIDVSQIPSRENCTYGLHSMTKNRSYITIDFLSILNEKCTMKKLQQMLSDGIARGWVRPLSRVIYSPAEISNAFRLLAGSNQRGRVLLRLQQDIDDLCVQPRLQCSSENLNVIISDNEGFGLQLADMLISRGARKICFALPVSQDDFKLRTRLWRRQGVEITWECSSSLDIPEFLTDNWTILPEHIEGIYILITAKHRTVLETNTFVEKIDAVTRKVCPDLKHFALINTVNSVGEETCMARNKDGFSSTILRLPEFKEIGSNDNQGRVSIRVAVDAVERAIVSNESILSAHVVPTPPSSLLDQIAAVAELNILQDITDASTLSDLGTDVSKANIVLAYLRNTHNILFTVDGIRGLTVERIKYIDETLTKTTFENKKGLCELFTCVDTDELVATTETVFMTTLAGSSIGRDVEFDATKSYLCIVPGLEGHYGRFRTMCERLKISALVLQPDIDRPHETIPELARRFAEVISKTASPGKLFYLLGYESGVFIVLEMAAILEENGFKTLVFCVGAPGDIHTEIKSHIAGLDTKEALQDAIVRHMYVMMTNSSTDDLELALQGVSSWQEKLNVTVRVLLGTVAYSAQYARQLIVAAYARMLSLLDYEMKNRALHSQLIILQPKSDNAMTRAALQQYSQQSVVCYQLQAPLSQALDDLRCAGIVNAHLDADVLKEFEEKNRCESYFHNSGEIVTWTTDLLD